MRVASKAPEPIKKILRPIVRPVRRVVTAIKESRRPPVRRVAIIGWLGAFNLGDEMMLEVTLNEMKSRGWLLTLVTHSDDKKVLVKYQDCQVVPRRPLEDMDIDRLVKENDALFVNGGALIDGRGYSSGNSLARDVARVSRKFIDSEKQVVLYGLSSNTSIQSAPLITDYGYIISRSAYFSVRDEFSKKELSKFAPEDKIDIVDDIVFANNILSAKTAPPQTADRIAVIMVFDGNTMEYIKRFFDKLLRVTDAPVRLILFYDENNNDAIRSAELIRDLGDRKFQIEEVMSPRNTQELYNALLAVDLVFSMRYHGTLFANAIGKKVICLEYDKHPHYHNKNHYLIDHYSFASRTIKISKIDELSDEGLLDMMESAQAPLAQIDQVHQRARRSLLEAIDLL